MKRALRVAALLSCACQRIYLLDGGTEEEDDAGFDAGVDGGFDAGVDGGTDGGTVLDAGFVDGGCACVGGCAVGACDRLCVSPAGLASCDGGLCSLPLPFAGEQMTRLWATNGGDVWVTQKDRVLHWDGQGWWCVQPQALTVINDVWASRQEAWVVGESATTPVMRIVNDAGITWHAADAGGPFFGANAVWGTQGRVYVATDAGQIVKWTLAGWLPAHASAISMNDVQGVVALDGGVWVYAAGSQGRVVREDAGSWSPESAGSGELIAVTVRRDGTAHVVNPNGNAFVRSASGWSMEQMLLAGSDVMRGLASEADEVWGVAEVGAGAEGLLLRRDPSLGWQRVLRYPRAFRDVSALIDGGVWLSGDGLVAEYLPANCNFLTVPIADDFNAPTLSPGWAAFTSGTGWTLNGAGQVQADLGVNAGDTTQLYAALARPGFRGLAVTVQIVRAGAVAVGDGGISTVLYASDPADAGSKLKFDVSHGRLHSYAQGDTTVHKTGPEPVGGVGYLRIREAGGLVFYEHAHDPLAQWTLFDIWDGGVPFLDTIDRVGIGAFNSDMGGVIQPLFDNLNRCPR